MLFYFNINNHGRFYCKVKKKNAESKKKTNTNSYLSSFNGIERCFFFLNMRDGLFAQKKNVRKGWMIYFLMISFLHIEGVE